MNQVEHVRLAREAFREELAQRPALTLRGANAVDSYERPEPFDAALDEPTDDYLERHTFWAMPYLDARSWRHYLPRIIEYALAHPNDPAMVVEATVRSLRPPDRVPARLATLSGEQEAVVRRFLEHLALSDDEGRRSRSGGSRARTCARNPPRGRRRDHRRNTASRAAERIGSRCRRRWKVEACTT